MSPASVECMRIPAFLPTPPPPHLHIRYTQHSQNRDVPRLPLFPLQDRHVRGTAATNEAEVLVQSRRRGGVPSVL